MTNKYLSAFNLNNQTYQYYSLKELAKDLDLTLDTIPFSLRILLENIIRLQGDQADFPAQIDNLKNYFHGKIAECEILFLPARVLMQDFTGVPAVVDLAAMREALAERGFSPEKINPFNQVDLVIDHSVMVDFYGNQEALNKNTEAEMYRNKERYEFLKWGQQAFSNFAVVPPGTGICHQVNLEYLAPVAYEKEGVVYPDSLVGTDSHTTMINGLGVLGYGVGGIEAEAAMLAQPISMILPKVVGFELKGKLAEGVTATDLVLAVTEKLRKHGVVGKFVEFFGDALSSLALSDRATIANMAPEYGATCGFFPIDYETLNYMHLTGRKNEQIELTEAYAKVAGLFNEESVDLKFDECLSLDLAEVKASMSGPKRPQDRRYLAEVPDSYLESCPENREDEFEIESADYTLKDGNVVIAAITSCTNTSNPNVMIAAGLVAKKALQYGLQVKPYVKTSLAPGSKAVSKYLEQSGLQESLDELGFNVVGYGCTTCIGNSGPLNLDIEAAIKANNINVASVLSGNRNFEGRVHPLTKANYLASPPLVVAYALFGKIDKDITQEPIGVSTNGQEVYLKDIWPTQAEINEIVAEFVTREIFIEKYADVFAGDKAWQEIEVAAGKTYEWNENSSYVKNPPFFSDLEVSQKQDVKSAKIIALLGDSITTDHISPAGSIAANSPAALYLAELGIAPQDFNSYGSRRGNHEVMMRGTFANIRIKNEMLTDGSEGGYTIYQNNGEVMSIYDACMKYQESNTALVVIAGKEYGTGSSRDWAAKGTRLLGIKAVITESFERIHRSNLIGMGVLPLEFKDGLNRKNLNLTGKEEISLETSKIAKAGQDIAANISYPDGSKKELKLKLRIDTEIELENYLSGGILQKVIKNIITS